MNAIMSVLLRIVCPYCDAISRVVIDRTEESPVCGVCKQIVSNGEPLELNDSNFDRHIFHSDWPVLVDFWAPWGGPCRTLDPVIHEVARQLKSQLRVAKVNTEVEGKIASRFGILSIPTLIIFHHGKVVCQRSGTSDLASLLAWVKVSLQ